MKCPQCHTFNAYDSIVCGNPDCQTPFYSLEIKNPHVFLERPLCLVLEVTNNGLDPILPERCLVAGQPVEVDRAEAIDSGHSRIVSFVLPADISIGTYQPELVCWLQGKQVSLPQGSGSRTFNVVAAPDIRVHGLESIEVKPSYDYKVQANVVLANSQAASCEHVRVAVEIDDETIVGQALQGANLDSDTAECTFLFTFPPMEPGEKSGRVSVHGGLLGDLVYEADVLVYVYAPPVMQVEYGQWGDEVFEYKSANGDRSILWRAPSEEAVNKRVRIRLIDDGGEYSEVEGNVSLRAENMNFPTSEYNFAGEMIVDATLDSYRGEPLSSNRMVLESGALNVTLSGVNKAIPMTIERFVVEKNVEPLCLDFGTSNCCTALVRPDESGSPDRLGTVPMDYDDPSWLLKSAVDREDGQLVFGREVLDMDLAHPLFRLHPIKQKMFDVNASEEDRKESAKLARALMRCCFQRAQQWLTDQPHNAKILFDNIVLTVPTSFPQRWKTELVDTAREVAETVFGSVRVSEIDEATAVLRYLLESKSEEVESFTSYDIVAICDFGGGSTDVVILQQLEPENNKPSYKPLSLGGIPNFGSTNLNEVIRSAISNHDREADITVEQHIAERLKRRLSDVSGFMDCLKDDLGISSRNMREVLFSRCRDATMEKVSEELEASFPDLLKRVSRRLEVVDNPKVLLLLAGQGAKLNGFESLVKTAWIKACADVRLPFTAPDVVMMKEPKRCVALGGFQSYGNRWRLTGVANFIPQDFLVKMDNKFAPEDRSNLITLEGQQYYRVLEAANELDENDEARVAIPLDALDRSYDEMLPLKLFSRLPGGKAIYMQEFSESPPSVLLDELTGMLEFVYKAEGAKIDINYI